LRYQAEQKGHRRESRRAALLEVGVEAATRLGQSDHEHARHLHGRMNAVAEVLRRALAGEPIDDLLTPGPDQEETPSAPPSAWLTEPDYPATFAIEPHQFEVLLADATRRVREDIGDDAHVRLWYVLVHLDGLHGDVGLPIVIFGARSENSQKQSHVEYAGSIDRVTVTTLPSRVIPRLRRPQPWVEDPTYLRLVHESWRRVNRPFFGVGMLIAREWPFPGTNSIWLTAFVPTAGPLAGNGSLFTLTDGTLREMPE
jgi:hypothetical protein